MAHPISLVGAIHTVLSIPPVLLGLYAIGRYHGIDPAKGSGKLYLAGLALSVLTSFALSSTGGLNVGHVLGVLALVAAFGGVLVERLSFLGRSRPYLSAMGLSFSFFLLLVPGINETLTRLPPSAPLGDGIASPVVRGTLLAWVGIFIVGLCLQAWRIRAARVKATRQGAAAGACLAAAFKEAHISERMEP